MYIACSRINDIVYCYGGKTTNGNFLRDHISLDLTQFNNVNSFDISAIQWNTKLSTSLNGSPLTSIVFGQSASINTNEGYVIFGGFADDMQNIGLDKPFIKYHIDSDQWSSLPLPNGNNYT